MDNDDKFLTPTELYERWQEMGLKIQKKTIERWRQHNEGPPYYRITDLPRAPIRYPLEGIEEFEIDMFREFTYD